ncbi:hypothetical protein [Paraburkholderia caribensis]|uniref:hypothetical protein n=1 Tax=Paraburkholderia caribensis TaxID=75105 RepID=UPI002866F86B|nr:hypothetical protein [Paraburkholderia caribensis]MDR6381779.1 hypothetical protein [Paraburkholderia caribensis]
MKEDIIDMIANDGMRNAAGGIYFTRIYEFANAIEAEATAPLLARIAELEANVEGWHRAASNIAMWLGLSPGLGACEIQEAVQGRLASSVADGAEKSPASTGSEAARADSAMRRELSAPSRIGDQTRIANDADSAMAKDAEIARLNAIINTPHSDDFLQGVSIEAEYQRQLHGVDAEDCRYDWPQWFWVVGYLVGKAFAACKARDAEKAKHHLVTSAALLANWHNVMSGKPAASVHSNTGRALADALASASEGGAA